jgi:transcriptional regulator with PAS, ATPase and Fis domain
VASGSIKEILTVPHIISSSSDVSSPIVKRAAMTELVLSQAEAVARTDSLVLIIGETGVGKDVMARYIHSLSPYASKKMVTVNCGALPDSLFESEFFGHEKGAFTGASVSREGLLEAADGFAHTQLPAHLCHPATPPASKRTRSATLAIMSSHPVVIDRLSLF